MGTVLIDCVLPLILRGCMHSPSYIHVYMSMYKRPQASFTLACQWIIECHPRITVCLCAMRALVFPDAGHDL